MLAHARRTSRWITFVDCVGAALFIAWTVLALAAYVGVDAGLAWLDRTLVAEGWITRLLAMSGIVDSPTLAVLWMAGTAIIVMLALVLRVLIDRRA